MPGIFFRIVETKGMDEMTHLQRAEQTLREVIATAERMRTGEITREQALALLTRQPGGFSSDARAGMVLDAALKKTKI